MGFISVLKLSLQQTSVRGVPRLIKQQDVFLKMLWLIGISLLASLAMINLYMLLSEYLAYKTVTWLKQGSLLSMKLDPISLTMCNLNPYPSTPVQGILTKQEHTQIMDNILRSAASSMNTSDPLVQNMMSRIYSTKGYYEYIGKENARKAGHQKEMFIVSCHYLVFIGPRDKINVACNDSLLQQISHPDYLNCYSMLVDTNSAALAQVYVYGVSIVIHLDQPASGNQQRYTSYDSDSQLSGVGVSMHSAGKLSKMLTDRQDVMPGHQMSLSSVISAIRRMQPPFGTCEESTGSVWDMDGGLLVNHELHCESACINRQVADTCGCLDSVLGAVSNVSDLGLPYCGAPTTDPTDMLAKVKCALTVTEKEQYICHDKCHPLCFEFEYDGIPNVMPWPRKSQRIAFYASEIAGKQKPYSGKYTVYGQAASLYADNKYTEAEQLMSSTTLMEDNFIKVELFVKTDIVMTTEEVAKTTNFQLLSQLGGILNLYSGISLIVILELLELIYLMSPLRSRESTFSASNDKGDSSKDARQRSDELFSQNVTSRQVAPASNQLTLVQI